MAFNVSYNYIARDKFSSVARKINSSVVNLGKKIKDTGNKFLKAIPKLDKFKKKLRDISNSSRRLGQSLATKLTLPIAALGAAALFQSAKFETFQISFESMLGSAKRAVKLMTSLKRFSAETPFRIDGIASSTKALLTFGVVQKDMIQTLRMLGDIASGSGAPLKEIAQIFGKGKLKAKLMTEELLQFSDRGIPVIKELSAHFGILPSDIFKAASESKLAFSIVEESLKRLTSSGGLFFEQTKKQSQTLAGLWSTFSDNISLSLAAFGDMNVKIFGLKDVLRKIIAPLSKLPEKIAMFTKENPGIAKMMIIFLGVLAILGPLLIAIGLLGAVIPFIAAGFGALATVAIATFTAIKLGLLALFSPIGLIVVAIAAIGFIIFKNWDAIASKTSEMIAFIKESFSNFVSAIIGFFISIPDKILEVFLNIKSFIDNIITAMKQSFSNFVSAIIGFFISIPDKIIGFFISIPDKIMEGFLTIKSFIDNIITAMKKSFSNFVSAIIGFFISIPDKILEVFLNIKSFIDNIIGGIFGKIGDISSSILSFFSSTKNKTDDFFNNADTDIQRTMTTNEMLSTQARAQANVNINLAAPKKAIDSIQTQITGDRQAMNLGTNLVTQ